MYTSLKNEDVDAVIRLLTEKYGKNFKHEDKERTDGIKTGQWMWELPGFYIIYHQQAQIPGGHAFDGGYLEIYTQEWKDFQAELESKNAKPDL